MLPTTKEDKLLLAGILDKQRQCDDKMYLTNSGFLDEREQALAEAMLGQGALLWGGYAEAERRCVVFLPDYMTEIDTDSNPLAVLRATPAARETKLTHRDYLGALLGLGIKRQVVGDIIVRPTGADILILRDMADYLLLNYNKVGRHFITVEILPTTAVAAYIAPFKEISANVSSLRLDSLAAAAFGVSRQVAAEAIRARLVAANGVAAGKPDLMIATGDKITWRGKGKAELFSIDGKSRKDRIFVTIKRYI